MCKLQCMSSFLFFTFLFREGISSSECVFKDSGREYDMSSFHYKQDAVGTDLDYDYKMNLCGTVVDDADCSSQGGSICQYDEDGLVAVVAKWSASPEPTWAWIDETDKKKGLTLDFKNGDTCQVSGQTIVRSASLTLTCNPQEDGTTFAVDEDPPCTFTIGHESKTACEIVNDQVVAVLSPGSIFCIAFAGLCVCYLLIGIIVNIKKNEKSGSEALPQYEFWKDLPSLLKEGCGFCISKIKMCAQCGKKPEYEEI